MTVHLVGTPGCQIAVADFIVALLAEALRVVLGVGVRAVGDYGGRACLFRGLRLRFHL